MDVRRINETMQSYVEGQEMAGGALFVRQGGEVLYRRKWGNVAFDSIYRLMSMTKCITAAAAMICVERGLMGLDEPLSAYIPEFQEMKVMMNRGKNGPAKREITIRDLLSHSSGLQQGPAGMQAMMKERKRYNTLRDYVLHYAEHTLDFQPGEGTGYSPVAGFDVLGYVVSLVSGMALEDFIRKEICVPLGMKDTTFYLSEEQEGRLVDVYKKKRGRLVKVTGTKDDMAGCLHQREIRFEHGSGGIYSTLDDYAGFGEMLLCGGSFRGVRILKPETVELMHTEAPKKHLEPGPGLVWGLGMMIRQDPERAGSFATEGTYGWSGAFGTHFFISPKDRLEAVFMMNRSDIGGSGSYISAKVEELVFGIWGGKP